MFEGLLPTGSYANPVPPDAGQSLFETWRNAGSSFNRCVAPETTTNLPGRRSPIARVDRCAHIPAPAGVVRPAGINQRRSPGIVHVT